MRKRFWIVSLVAVLVLGGVAYRVWRDVQAREAAWQLYRELPGDHAEIEHDIVDNPLFEDLDAKDATSPSAAPEEPGDEAAAPAPRPAPSDEGEAAPDTTAVPATSTKPAPPTSLDQPTVIPNLVRGSRPNPYSDKVHVLLVGTDEEELGRGRADTIIVLTLDPKSRELILTSVPRDTRMKLRDKGVHKVNAAYAFGGMWLLARSLEEFLGFPFQYYVEVSLAGFRKAIDEVGGVTVNPPFAFSWDGFDFEPGETRLGGEAALAYARMRKLDPRGDFGRNDRQREVIRSLMSSLARTSQSGLDDLLARLQGSVRTDFSPRELIELRAKNGYALDPQRQVTEAVAGEGATIDGLYYFVVSDEERRRLHVRLR